METLCARVRGCSDEHEATLCQTTPRAKFAQVTETRAEMTSPGTMFLASTCVPAALIRKTMARLLAYICIHALHAVDTPMLPEMPSYLPAAQAAHAVHAD